MLEVQLRLESADRTCVTLHLTAMNRGSVPLLIPELRIVDLEFVNGAGEPASWFTGLLVSRPSAETVIAPGQSTLRVFQVRPEVVDPKKGSTTPDFDYQRWCVNLEPGKYVVSYRLAVDEDYFHPDSHIRFETLSRIADREGAVAWRGEAISNAVEFQYEGTSCKSTMVEADVELLTVEHRFAIDGRGVLVVPDFPVPGRHGWKELRTQVTVVSPDGACCILDATFGMSHFNIHDPQVSIEQRWRITLVFPTASESQVPVGSRVLGASEIARQLGVL